MALTKKNEFLYFRLFVTIYDVDSHEPNAKQQKSLATNEQQTKNNNSNNNNIKKSASTVTKLTRVGFKK